ncbi:hypothetical protein [Synechococcus elongatus]|uniref:hypothetical protein n=1 Tax=Synechococcus elongatus TaxID=32046 RepID=UPI001EDFDB4B|nr:hypothetical protein [Synechococcus elongatus]
MMQPANNHSWISKLTKNDLHQLIEEVKTGNRDAVSKAALFVAHESFGLWHNRARAKLCRHFKNHPPAEVEEQNRMIAAIIQQLIDGCFSEQFMDQLSMAIRLDPKQMQVAAIAALTSPKAYVRRYAERTLHIINASSKVQPNR